MVWLIAPTLPRWRRTEDENGYIERRSGIRRNWARDLRAARRVLTVSADVIQALYADLDDLARVHSDRVAEIRRKIEAFAGEPVVDVLAGYEWASVYDWAVECGASFLWPAGAARDEDDYSYDARIGKYGWSVYDPGGGDDAPVLARGDETGAAGRRAAEAALRKMLEARR